MTTPWQFPSGQWLGLESSIQTLLAVGMTMEQPEPSKVTSKVTSLVWHFWRCGELIL